MGQQSLGDVCVTDINALEPSVPFSTDPNRVSLCCMAHGPLQLTCEDKRRACSDIRWAASPASTSHCLRDLRHIT